MASSEHARYLNACQLATPCECRWPESRAIAVARVCQAHWHGCHTVLSRLWFQQQRCARLSGSASGQKACLPVHSLALARALRA